MLKTKIRRQNLFISKNNEKILRPKRECVEEVKILGEEVGGEDVERECIVVFFP